MKIVFATNNQHKLSEIRSILGDNIEVLSLKDIGCDVDIPETGIGNTGRQRAKSQNGVFQGLIHGWIHDWRAECRMAGRFPWLMSRTIRQGKANRHTR